MPTYDELYREEEGKWLSPEDKKKLIRELQERLKEIERLKKELNSEAAETPPQPASEKSSERTNTPSSLVSSSSEHVPEDTEKFPVSTGRVAEEVEELRVPSLEVLDDKPIPKKKKEEKTT